LRASSALCSTDENAAQAWPLYLGFDPDGVIGSAADQGVNERVYRLTP
jgi:hypothetical protein